jgi:hypothetical protein
MFNNGGMPDMFVQMHKARIEHAKEHGQLSDDEAQQDLQKLEDHSRPVKERFRFIKTIILPFIPYDGLILNIEGFKFHVMSPVYNMETGEFDCEMGMSVCSDCGHESCDLATLREHWDWVPPVDENDDEDDGATTTQPSEPDSQ